MHRERTRRGKGAVADLAAAGASRISIGPMAFRTAMAAVDRVAVELLRVDTADHQTP